MYTCTKITIFIIEKTDEVVDTKEDEFEGDFIFVKKIIRTEAEEVAATVKKSNSNDKECVYKSVFFKFLHIIVLRQNIESITDETVTGRLVVYISVNH